jgi:hypothetical protein
MVGGDTADEVGVCSAAGLATGGRPLRSFATTV